MIATAFSEIEPSHPAGEARTLRPGVAVSLIVHGLAAFFLIYHLNAPPVDARLPIVPVEIIRLAEQTVLPLQPQKAGPPQRTASLPPRPPRPAPVRPTPAEPAIPNPPAEAPAPKDALPKDALETKLQALARLRQPDSDPRLLNGLTASASQGTGLSGTRGDGAGYSVKDLIRVQVERRWNLDTAELGTRDFTVAIHVVLAADGSVTTAEIVEQKRAGADAAYRSIALAARNAVLLSSPFVLPEIHEQVIDVTLTLNPRDTLR
jgi:hypothetical protein